MSLPVLYQYWRSSASWRVRWALAIKRIQVENVPVNIVAGEQFTPEHKKRNPIGHVPALFIDGHCLAESVAIIEYLEETHPSPALYPKDPWLRARARQAIETVNAGIQPLQNLSIIRRHSEEGPAQREFAAFFIDRGMTALETLLRDIERETGGGPFAMGRELSAVDLFLVPQMNASRRFSVDVNKFPRALAIEAAALATEHAAAALPENQPDAPKQ